jgi:hypothetical protein
MICNVPMCCDRRLISGGYTPGVAVGEEAHIKGMQGVRRARQWLESTMRISSSYANTDTPKWAEKLTLEWPHTGNTFSFDLGGTMRGAEYEGDQFCAEVKNYTSASNQGIEFRSFLAKCYVARMSRYTIGDHFMWITWAPFSVNSWNTLDSPETVVEAVVEHRGRIFGDVTEEKSRSLIDAETARSVSERLWVIVLSQKQETLVPLDDWRAIVVAALEKAKASR